MLSSLGHTRGVAGGAFGVPSLLVGLCSSERNATRLHLTTSALLLWAAVMVGDSCCADLGDRVVELLASIAVEGDLLAVMNSLHLQYGECALSVALLC